MHWFSFQINILVHITYHHNLTFDPTYLKSRILKEVRYYILDKKEHDTLFVQHAFKLNWEFLNKKSCFPKCHVVWSHGWGGQFKFARCWYFLLWYHNITICEQHLFGCQMVWNYFYSGHGKGEVDGAKTLLKREVRKKKSSQMLGGFSRPLMWWLSCGRRVQNNMLPTQMQGGPPTSTSRR
jgi:hypothetical protein